MTQPARRRPKALVTKTITVPGNLRQAVHEFNSGLFFECHESLEEVWQEEQGEVRDLYKGLIQVAAAFVHAGRDNRFGVNRLLATGVGYLAPYREEGAMGFNVDAICRAGEAVVVALRELPDDRIHELVALAPEYRLDESRLAAEAERWGAWGFDRAGNALPMEITVAE